MNPKDIAGSYKPPLHLIPGPALVLESLVMQLGADKYGAANWRHEKVQASAYVDAMLRHLLAWQDGEDMDPESGLSHLAHVRAGAGILLDAIESDSWIDNRPPKGATAALIKRHTKRPPEQELGT